MKKLSAIAVSIIFVVLAMTACTLPADPVRVKADLTLQFITDGVPTAAPVPTPAPTAVPTPVPSKPLLWDPYLDEIGVTVQRRDGDYELIAGWHTENGNWDNVPTWAKRWQDDTLGGDHHVFGRCENDSGHAILNSFGIIWPGGGDQRTSEANGWANIPMAGQNWNPANGPGPYEWFAFGGDKVRGLGMPHNHHVSYFFVWREK